MNADFEIILGTSPAALIKPALSLNELDSRLGAAIRDGESFTSLLYSASKRIKKHAKQGKMLQSILPRMVPSTYFRPPILHLAEEALNLAKKGYTTAPNTDWRVAAKSYGDKTWTDWKQMVLHSNTGTLAAFDNKVSVLNTALASGLDANYDGRLVSAEWYG